MTGAVAGAVATVPMTALMEAGFRRLPRKERYPLPPREIVEEFAEQTNAPLPQEEERRLWLTLVAHVGYGAAVGTPAGFVTPSSVPAAGVWGTALGSGVWAASYLGLLPALGLLRPVTEHPPRRTALNIASHLLWGVTAVLVAYALRRRA